MKKIPPIFTVIIAILIIVAIVYGASCLIGIHKCVAGMWRLAFVIFAGWGLIFWWDIGECFFTFDLLEGLKKFLVGLLFLVIAYFLIATLAPSIQWPTKWDKPAFLEKPVQSEMIEIAPQEIEPLPLPPQKEETTKKKPVSHMPDMG